MSRDSILLANSRRVASESRTRGSLVEHYQHVAPVAVGVGPSYAGRLLRDGAVEDLNLDGSTTPAEFVLAPEAAEVLRVYRLRLVLTLATAPTWATFGNLAALGTGLSLAVVDDDGAELVDLLDGETVKSNADLALLGSVEVSNLGATYLLTATIDFAIPIRVDGGAEERLILTVADNLAGLTSARCRVDAFDEGDLR